MEHRSRTRPPIRNKSGAAGCPHLRGRRRRPITGLHVADLASPRQVSQAAAAAFLPVHFPPRDASWIPNRLNGRQTHASGCQIHRGRRFSNPDCSFTGRAEVQRGRRNPSRPGEERSHLSCVEEEGHGEQHIPVPLRPVRVGVAGARAARRAPRRRRARPRRPQLRGHSPRSAVAVFFLCAVTYDQTSCA